MDNFEGKKDIIQNGSESINGTYLSANWEGFMSSFNINSSNGEICSKRLVVCRFCYCFFHHRLYSVETLLFYLVHLLFLCMCQWEDLWWWGDQRRNLVS